MVLTLVDASIRQEMDIIIIGIKQKDGKIGYFKSFPLKQRFNLVIFSLPWEGTMI